METANFGIVLHHVYVLSYNKINLFNKILQEAKDKVREAT